jgi:UDP-N-acetylmuramoylalanine--D-glutamate ligase
MNSSKILSKKSFAIYGLGSTGISVVNYFKKNKFRNFRAWDDKKKIKNINCKKEIFIKSLEKSDFIVVSPGININKSLLKKYLVKNSQKIITDLDLYYMMNSNTKSIVVTGTNGKSTTCKIIEHLLRKNKFDVKLGGNIGKPILELNIKKTTIVIIEASSFQLAYSKFIKPTYSIILNITKDHLDWHGNMKNYLNAKFKIFSLQDNKEHAILKDKNIIKIFKRKNFSSKLKTVNINSYNSVKIKIKNSYLQSQANLENMSFVYELSKSLKINKSNFIKSCNSFKGLPHRHEIFYKKKNIIFINDSKATSFEACKFALMNNKNIFWIVGGMPKLSDKFYLKKFKNSIIKSFIIGKNTNFFKSQLKNKIDYKVTKTIKKSLLTIFDILKNKHEKIITVLLCPASASYDQYKNFEERGNEFKKLVKLYAGKYI